MLALKFLIEDNSPAEAHWRHERNDGAIHVMDWQHAHHALCIAHCMPLRDTSGIAKEIQLREHDPLRVAGRATGINDQCFIFARDGLCACEEWIFTLYFQIERALFVY